MSPQLPDFTRIAYRDQASRAWWEAVRQDWGRAWLEVERQLVVDGVRQAAYQHCSPDELPALAEWGVRHGLAVVPRQVPVSAQPYTSCEGALVPGGPWQYRVIVAAPENARALLNALAVRDDGKVGQLLGYPVCCRGAFCQTWGKGQVDSTFEAGASGPPLINIWLRWAGVRLVPHLPCDSACMMSKALASDALKAARRLGYRWETDEAVEMLAWPMEWSRLHGIAWISTPAMRISTRTDHTLHTDRLARDGAYRPADARWWTENGFSAPGPMRAAHRAIVAALRGRLVPGQSRVVDLGAGNGMLLDRILRDVGAIETLGVEREPDIIRLAGGEWMTGDIGHVPWAEWSPDTVLLMPGRLLELPPERAAVVREHCLAPWRTLLLYAYSDNLQPDGLEGLARRAGLDRPLLTLSSSPSHAVGITATR
jgi:hypothetical protein